MYAPCARSLSKLWVNGKVAGLEAGELEIDAPDQWRVRARLGDGHPFRQVAVVSAVLEDGTGGARPGRAGRADADGDEVVIEGTDGPD